ncbi:MAG: M43 family zinc metalloprotease [Ginsengibacter sp.]
MKIIFTSFFLCFFFSAFSQRCGTIEYQKKHPVNPFTAQRSLSPIIESRDTSKDEVIIIPVVVHVLYNTNEQNISDAQVISQIASLNRDYRRLNEDTINTPAPFKNVAADTKIQFCLAKVDPRGQYTTGIIHKFTREAQFFPDDAMKFSSKGGDDAWDATTYLNLWVCNLSGQTLGYTVLPGSPLEKDGVVIKYTAFGTIGNLSAPYIKGRTATHEIGHWLGLKHLWGDSTCGDDGIADTPPQQTSNTYCPVFPHISTCSINSYGDMFMNFMDFTDDGCMNMFTEGQKAEMRSLFALGNPRNSFLNSKVCDSSTAEGAPVPKDSISSTKINIYPNPFNQIFNITSDGDDISGKIIKIYSINGKLYLTQKILSPKTILNVSDLPSGIYILKINGIKGQNVYKIIKADNQ